MSDPADRINLCRCGGDPVFNAHDCIGCIEEGDAA